MKYLIRLAILFLAIYAVWYIVRKNDKPPFNPPFDKPFQEPLQTPPKEWPCDLETQKCP